MTKVTAYKSVDGKVFSHKQDCLSQDFMINIRSFIQSKTTLPPIGDHIQISQLSRMMLTNRVELSTLLQSWNRKIARCNLVVNNSVKS